MRAIANAAGRNAKRKADAAEAGGEHELVPQGKLDVRDGLDAEAASRKGLFDRDFGRRILAPYAADGE